MARPQKQGIDYFSLDVDFDSSLETILSKFGEKGLGIAVRIWQRIYKSKGYYIPYNEDELYMIKRICNDSNIDEIKMVIEAMVEKNLFNKELFNEGILTSKRLQLNYKTATKKRVSAGSNPPYWILNSGSNPKKTTQSKVNNSKVNKKKVIPLVEQKEKETIPFKEIIEYLNLKVKGTYRHTTKKTRTYITTRWNEGFRLDDFYKAIDNTYLFRMEQGGDLTYVRPVTIFNGDFENRVNGTAFGFKQETKKKVSYDDV